MRLPACITGGYRSGKTTRLRSLAEQYDRPLVVCATAASAEAFGMGAMTFWDVARWVLDDDVAIPPSSAAHEDPHMAEAICHYQASFLGLEELRTHADAAGCLDQWEEVAAAAVGVTTWASVLVDASLKLRDEAVLESVRSRFDAVLVDDFEAASFATNRLLSQLAGYGGPVAVAGNPDNAVWRHLAGSPGYLARFPKRFGAVDSVVLGTDSSASTHGAGAENGRRARLLVAPGGDPWLPLPDGPMPVALASSLSWATVELEAGGEPASSPYDLDVLGGPDVPSDEERAARKQREDEARWALARSRGGVA